MLVYGDHARLADPLGVLEDLRTHLAFTMARPPGLARHALLVGGFLEASELAQGLADAELRRLGVDARTPLTEAAMQLVHELARDVARSWSTGFAATPGLPRSLATLRGMPDTVEMRRAEGYAFYAVYPEAYLAAARRAPAGPYRVIGIRSIGAGLAAIVANARDAAAPISVRPHGDPFDRRVTLDPAVTAELTSPGATIAIVDEGPGMSGSSFGAVADLLEDHGVPLERITCFPSHDGELGPRASDRHRARWQRVRRSVVDVDSLLLHAASPEHELRTWIGELVGPVVGELQDLSAGAWRHRRYPSEAAWPPSVRMQERRKLLARTADGTWLARFVGLGRDGERALDRARRLHGAGFTPEVAGLCHGFLIERWIEHAHPIALPEVERARLIDHVGRYLGFRARAFPASRDRGASPARLAEMTARNITLALGADAAAAIARRTPAVGSHARPIEVDARLHAWEWQQLPGMRWVKTDAIDHHCAHDLVGCQDIAWDLAGAAVELALSPVELERLGAVVAEVAGTSADRELVAAYRAPYLAFQLGRHALAIDPGDPAEASRLHAIVETYAGGLRELAG